MTDAGLSGANLRGAHLEGVQSLEARAIRGADVTGARLPGEIGEFKGVDTVASIAPAVATQFLAILAACLYCLITVAATKDRALVLDTPPVASDLANRYSAAGVLYPCASGAGHFAVVFAIESATVVGGARGFAG